MDQDVHYDYQSITIDHAMPMEMVSVRESSVKSSTPSRMSADASASRVLLDKSNVTRESTSSESPPTFYGHDPSIHMEVATVQQDDKLQLEAPPDVDRMAFLMGQSTALQHCFRQALPRQQELGALHSGVDDLRVAHAEESGRVRNVESAGAALHEAVRSLEKRFVELEREKLSRLEQQNGELRSEVIKCQTDFEKVMEETRDTNLQRLLMATGRQLLRTVWGIGSQVDVLLLNAAKHVLLDKKARKEDGSELSMSNKRRLMIGSASLLTLVECGWRLDQAIRHRTGFAGAPLRMATAPFSSALRLSRGGLWAAAFVLAASQLKQYSFSIGEYWSNSMLVRVVVGLNWHLFKLISGGQKSLEDGSSQRDKEKKQDTEDSKPEHPRT
ncbi:hypothetical protein CYMTET_41846 [Cymbomonas tetramitiformis]|uniref:Uncharacterized protein n=1 Tax=Cymbomonas tetramitiformis TaxID=36881 RepID=A0AAE0F1T9_9CHLO|nr:hypothetical protein CYMTET_41846 [Cymbomonas tetramitiformis]